MQEPLYIPLTLYKFFIFQSILTKVNNEGMEVLSLSDMKFLRNLGQVKGQPDIEDLQQAWEGEKQSLVSAIQALRHLLGETQRTQDSNKVCL